MAEEHGFRASEGHRLCLNNCGFVGSPATQNFCSKCYNDLFRNQEIKATTKAATVTATVDPQVSLPQVSLPQVSLPCSSLTSSSLPTPSPSPSCSWKVSSSPIPPEVVVAVQPLTKPPNRCSTCRKKVGLTGFRCRCGITFCGTHRYPEHHGCEFDYKTMGREAIAKANPVIKAEKLEKI